MKFGPKRKLNAEEFMLLNCVVGENSWASLGLQEIKPVHLKANQSWIFIGRTDTEGEAPVLWPPDVNNWLIGKGSHAGKDWRWEEKGPTEDELVGWYHWLDGHEFEQAPGVGDGQGSLGCCRPWGCKESDMTEWLNWIQLNWLEIEEWLDIKGVFICLLVPFFGYFFRRAPIPVFLITTSVPISVFPLLHIHIFLFSISPTAVLFPLLHSVY